MNILSELTKEQKQLIALSAIVCITIFFLDWTLFFQPIVKQYTDSARMSGKVGKDLKVAKADVARIDKNKADIASLEEKMIGYEKIFPQEEEIPGLLENLSSMARESGVKIVAITPSGKSPGAASGVYQQILIRISARSGYHELGRFLNSIDKSGRFMKVVDVDIRGNRLSPKKHDIEIGLLAFILLRGK